MFRRNLESPTLGIWVLTVRPRGGESEKGHSLRVIARADQDRDAKNTGQSDGS